ncbi:MAG: hypothetical protein AAGC85_16625 [Bacteroidota bacterium]
MLLIDEGFLLFSQAKFQLFGTIKCRIIAQMKEKRSSKAAQKTLSASFERRYLTYPKSSLVIESHDESVSRFSEHAIDHPLNPKVENLPNGEVQVSTPLITSDENQSIKEKSYSVDDSSTFESIHLFKNQFFQIQEVPFHL